MPMINNEFYDASHAAATFVAEIEAGMACALDKGYTPTAIRAEVNHMLTLILLEVKRILHGDSNNVGTGV